VKNDSNLANKKQKKINKIKDQLAQLRAKLKASENKQSLSPSKPKLKKIKSENKQAENKKIKLIDAQRKAKEAKKKEARIKVEAKKKAKEAKEETKRKEEEAREEAERKEEEAKRTYEEELEEQLSEEEITGFQLEKTDMDKMCNRVCEIIAGYETK